MKKTILFISSLLFSIVLLGCGKMQNYGELRKNVTSMYPGAMITEIDRDDYGCIEVEFIHEKKRKEMTFDAGSNWLSTTWDVRRNELPTAVRNRLDTEYSAWRIDDADYVETPSGRWYDIELEKAGMEINLRISPDGTVY